MSFGVFGGVEGGSLDVEGAGFGIAAAKNEDQVLPAERLRHQFPSLAGYGVAGEGGFHQRRRVEFGFHGFHQVFSSVLRTAEARLFFFDFADLAVDLVTRGFGQGVEKFLEAFGLAEFAGEDRMDLHEGRKTLPRMRGMERYFHGDSPQRTRRTQRKGKRIFAADLRGCALIV